MKEFTKKSTNFVYLITTVHWAWMVSEVENEQEGPDVTVPRFWNYFFVENSKALGTME
jgi:hypothetical protein